MHDWTNSINSTEDLQATSNNDGDDFRIRFSNYISDAGKLSSTCCSTCEIYGNLWQATS